MKVPDERMSLPSASNCENTEHESAHRALRIKDAEIERLRKELQEDAEVMVAMGITIEGRNVLIGELADALEARARVPATHLIRLIHRARDVKPCVSGTRRRIENGQEDRQQ